MFGWTELLIVFGIVILLFGASRLPKIARSMGLSVGKFKEGLEEGKQGTDDSKSAGEIGEAEDPHLNEEE